MPFSVESWVWDSDVSTRLDLEVNGQGLMTESFEPSLFCLPAVAPLRDALALMRRNERGIVLAIDEERRLVRIVTDDDIRQAILEEIDLETSMGELDRNPGSNALPGPVVGNAGGSPRDYHRQMETSGTEHLPVVDDSGQVVDLVFLDPSPHPGSLPLRAVVMAGGAGKRLRPLTESMPKPMLPLGDRPVMAHLIEQLRSSGIHRITVSTHFMPEKIQDYFGDGRKFGVEIQYVHEDSPSEPRAPSRSLKRWMRPHCWSTAIF